MNVFKDLCLRNTAIPLNYCIIEERLAFNIHYYAIIFSHNKISIAFFVEKTTFFKIGDISMMSKFNLLHISSSLKVGGAETLLCSILEKLLSEEVEHHVIYFHDGPIRARIEALGIKTYHVRGLFFIYDPIFWVRLWYCIKTIKPKRIHSLLWAANVASRLLGRWLGIPVVSAYHNNVVLDGAFRNRLDRWTVKYADIVVAINDDIARSVELNAPCISVNSIKVIRQGIDVLELARLNACHRVSREELNLSKEHVIIGAVGRWVKQKNYSLLLQAFASVVKVDKRIRLILVGQGPEEQALRAIAQQLDVYELVHFVSAFPAFGYYSLFDVFVQASTQEGVSLAILEAMSLRIPCVVASEQEVHPDIQHGKHGLVVPVGNVLELGKAIQLLIHDEKQRKRIADAAYDFVQRDFSQSATVRGYKECLLGDNK